MAMTPPRWAVTVTGSRGAHIGYLKQAAERLRAGTKTWTTTHDPAQAWTASTKGTAAAKAQAIARLPWAMDAQPTPLTTPHAMTTNKLAASLRHGNPGSDNSPQTAPQSEGTAPPTTPPR